MPVELFFEWMKIHGPGGEPAEGHNQPFVIAMAGRGPLALPTFWESWTDGTTGMITRNFAIVTRHHRLMRCGGTISRTVWRCSHRRLYAETDRRKAPGKPDRAPTMATRISCTRWKNLSRSRCDREDANLRTILRLQRRKTRPPLRSVITLALKKKALDETGAGEGTHLAQIRQSRCHRAGISFV